MGNMKVIPFNALSVDITSHECPKDMTGKSIDQVYSSYIGKLGPKQLELNWLSWDQTASCILGQLMLRFLSVSPSLEQLEIKWMPLNVQLKDKNKPAHAEASVGLPKLTSLKLPTDPFEEFFCSPIVQELINSKAPNLQVLQNSIDIGLLPEVPREKYRIIKRIDFLGSLHVNAAILNVISEFLESNPRLEAFSALQPDSFADLPGDHERFWTLLRNLLRSSCDTLGELDFDPYSITILTKAIAYVGFEWLRFPNVTQLFIHLPEGDDTSIDASILRLPMQDMFPSVTEVVFTAQFYVRRLIAPPIDEPTPWPAVTTIKVLGRSLASTSPILRDLAPLFPSVEHIKISELMCNPQGCPFRLLWGNYPRLRHLAIGTDAPWKVRFNTNYDAEFCGIYREEAEILSHMDEEYLKAVHIVSVFPAINDVKALQEVRIRIRFENVGLGASGSGGVSFFLSKVTRFVGMRRLDGLKIRLTVPSSSVQRLDLDHLKPWVEVKVEEQ